MYVQTHPHCYSKPGPLWSLRSPPTPLCLSGHGSGRGCPAQSRQKTLLTLNPFLQCLQQSCGFGCSTPTLSSKREECSLVCWQLDPPSPQRSSVTMNDKQGSQACARNLTTCRCIAVSIVAHACRVTRESSFSSLIYTAKLLKLNVI